MKFLEDRIQSNCYKWFHNNYPTLRGCLCYNLNNSRNAIDGSRNKGMGLQRGRADMVLYYQGKAYHVEIKTPDGRQQPEQRAWEALMSSHGFDYFVCRSIDEFVSMIDSIMNR